LLQVSNGCVIEIDHAGTTVSFRPGVLVGGKITHDCPVTKTIGYFLEALVWLAPFCKKPIAITLTGVTNNQTDPCVRSQSLACGTAPHRRSSSSSSFSSFDRSTRCARSRCRSSSGSEWTKASSSRS
jgi:hypothetical protein